MKLFEIVNVVNINNVNGAGAVPLNQEVDYFGIRVMMKPSTFLKLATPLSREYAKSVDGLKQHMQQGGSVASPWFNVEIPKTWHQNDLSLSAQVEGHEGRNRMMAIQEMYGDVPVEVHLFFRGGLRARDIKPDYIQKLNSGMYAEQTDNLILGPLFN